MLKAKKENKKAIYQNFRREYKNCKLFYKSIGLKKTLALIAIFISISLNQLEFKETLSLKSPLLKSEIVSGDLLQKIHYSLKK